jgi:mannose-1-phosphate guanylyltransferase / mannose-6-phosphate isomerase
LRALFLAGGGGTRLWPLSDERHPKQFLPLLSRRSLLQETFDRVEPMTRDVWVATAERHEPLVRTDLPRVPPERILTEPSRRNSAPAILRAALLFESDGDPVTAAIPSDQTVRDAEAFRRALSAGQAAADSASVVLLAIPPTRPETDYGYLRMKEPGSADGMEVDRFIEKPSAADAEKLVAEGCFWNGGIFVFRPSRFLAEARRVAGDLVEAVARYARHVEAGQAGDARDAWAALPAVSIDYAVMEKATDVRAVPLRAGWSDVGTWRSVRDLRGPSDERGNLIVSQVPVLAPGTRDCAIIVAEEGVLVMPFEKETELRAAVERLRRDDTGSGRARAGR